jgi:hypothetical protein
MITTEGPFAPYNLVRPDGSLKLTRLGGAVQAFGGDTIHAEDPPAVVA